MMHGHEKSDSVVVAAKPANKAAPRCGAVRGGGKPQRSRWSEGRGPRGMRTGKARTGLSARLACHRRWKRMRQLLAVRTRGGSRLRESRTYGSAAARLAAIP